MPSNPTKLNPKYSMYMNKEDLALNNLKWLICHKTKPILIILSRKRLNSSVRLIEPWRKQRIITFPRFDK